MFRIIGRSAVKLVNIKNISPIPTRALSLLLVQSGNNGKNYDCTSLLCMLVGAVITIATHKVMLMQLLLLVILTIT